MTATGRYFYPRPPRGGRRHLSGCCHPDPHFYPRPPRGGRPSCACAGLSGWGISIHALREEGDSRAGTHCPRSCAISIHALREEGDLPHQNVQPDAVVFLSTPSARRATLRRGTYPPHPEISIHALREEGDVGPDLLLDADHISIHALREEGDLRCRLPELCASYFYPRPPRGGRHATTAPTARSSNFYPRPPRGGRPFLFHSATVVFSFLSTPSARRATFDLLENGA